METAVVYCGINIADNNDWLAVINSTSLPWKKMKQK